MRERVLIGWDEQMIYHFPDMAQGVQVRALFQKMQMLIARER